MDRTDTRTLTFNKVLFVTAVATSTTTQGGDSVGAPIQLLGGGTLCCAENCSSPQLPKRALEQSCSLLCRNQRLVPALPAPQGGPRKSGKQQNLLPWLHSHSSSCGGGLLQKVF